MRLLTFLVDGQRRLGALVGDRVVDLAAAQAARVDGSRAIVDMRALIAAGPDVWARLASDLATNDLEPLQPAAGRDQAGRAGAAVEDLRHRPELSRPRAGGRPADPQEPRALRKVPYVGDRSRRCDPLGAGSLGQDRLGGRVGRGHRPRGAARAGRGCLRVCLRLRLCRRCDRARPPGPRRPMDARQVARHLLPAGPLDRHARRSARPAQPAHPLHGQR